MNGFIETIELEYIKGIEGFFNIKGITTCKIDVLRINGELIFHRNGNTYSTKDIKSFIIPSQIDSYINRLKRNEKLEKLLIEFIF